MDSTLLFNHVFLTKELLFIHPNLLLVKKIIKKILYHGGGFSII
jgi:hypothetical protein